MVGKKRAKLKLRLLELDLIKGRIFDDLVFLDVVVPAVDFKVKGELSRDCLFLQGFFPPNIMGNYFDEV